MIQVQVTEDWFIEAVSRFSAFAPWYLRLLHRARLRSWWEVAFMRLPGYVPEKLLTLSGTDLRLLTRARRYEEKKK